MLKFCVILTLFFIGFTTKNNAQAFLDLGNSAQISAMGGTNVALKGTPFSVFYNPSGIYNVNNIYVATSFSRLFPDIEGDQLNYFSLTSTVPVNVIGNFGVGVTYFSTELWNENTFSFTYAREIVKGIAAGATLKLLRWSATAAPGEEALSYFGYTFDIGAYSTLFKDKTYGEIDLGLVVKNLTQPNVSSNGSKDAEIPMQLALGILYHSHAYNYQLAFDVFKEKDIIGFRTGSEFSLFNRQLLSLNTNLLLRIGYNRILQSDFAKESNLTGGFGLIVESVMFDYAYVYPYELQNIGGTHKLSLSYKF